MILLIVLIMLMIIITACILVVLIEASQTYDNNITKTKYTNNN